MFDWLKKLFGEGYIYSEFTYGDGKKGKARAPYIGDPETFDEAEYIQALREEVYFKHNICISNVRTVIR